MKLGLDWKNKPQTYLIDISNANSCFGDILATPHVVRSDLTLTLHMQMLLNNEDCTKKKNHESN